MPKLSDIHDPEERRQATLSLLTVGPSDDSRVTVLYYGHSFVQHLRDYVKTRDELKNWGFAGRQADIHYYSQSGATIERMMQPQHLWHIEYMRPDIVIVEIATNDLSREGTEYEPDNLSSAAHRLVMAIRDRGVKRVVLNQVLPRGEMGMDRSIKKAKGRCVPISREERLEACKTFKDRAVRYNEACHPLINSVPLCMFWHHHNLWVHIDEEVEDGTHLNSVGHSKLIKSLKGALIVSMKLLRPAWYDQSGRLLPAYRQLFARELAKENKTKN